MQFEKDFKCLIIIIIIIIIIQKEYPVFCGHVPSEENLLPLLEG